MLRIGNIQLAHPFVQAALSGYSDLPMRRVARMHGACYTINEVVLERSVLHDGAWQRQLLTVPPDDHPVAAQLMGANPDDFGPAARRLANAGYDVIDINFGCPVNKVLKRCRGGYLLGEPDTALEIVRNVVDAVAADRPVTLKMRRGVDASADSERNFFAILGGAFDMGVSAVTVHGRSVAQRYTGPSDWQFLKRVKDFAGDRVILGSGDLMSAGDCLAMMRETGVNGVTIARGALGNPWIFRECLALAKGKPQPAPPTVAEQGETLAIHFAEAEQYYGRDRAGKVMTRVAIKYARHHPVAKRVREAFIAAPTADGFEGVLAEWYEGTQPAAPLGVAVALGV
ncbi:MAG: tRNA-dihydrouridine synthase [Phycisphaerales bacterium]|nr:tRNA-dihydrouridine synthase [Phycisphaerales bacterium]